jgi:hypothetical protein
MYFVLPPVALVPFQLLEISAAFARANEFKPPVVAEVAMERDRENEVRKTDKACM